MYDKSQQRLFFSGALYTERTRQTVNCWLPEQWATPGRIKMRKRGSTAGEKCISSIHVGRNWIFVFTEGDFKFAHLCRYNCNFAFLRRGHLKYFLFYVGRFFQPTVDHQQHPTTDYRRTTQRPDIPTHLSPAPTPRQQKNIVSYVVDHGVI